MRKAFDFLKECGVFYVLTMNGDRPAGRPFGAVMEDEKSLYFSTADVKDVYAQLKQNPHMQIVAWKPQSRDWIRMDAEAVECQDIFKKRKMLEECPALTKHFQSAEDEHFALFQLTKMDAELHTDEGKEKIDICD